jgi:hypothetical protein
MLGKVEFSGLADLAVQKLADLAEQALVRFQISVALPTKIENRW